MTKEYLGDGVYVVVENGMLKMTTENGISTDNTIYLEPYVFEALCNYVVRVTNEVRASREAEAKTPPAELADGAGVCRHCGGTHPVGCCAQDGHG